MREMGRTEDKPTLFLVPHGGLGDHIVCLPIYRHFAQTHNVLLPVKNHNLPSVQWMLRGLPVAFFSITNDEQVKRLADVAAKRGAEILKLGMFGEGFDEKHWSESMFEQAGLPFEARWSKWKVDRDLSREFEPPNEPYVFLHEDEDRGFLIDWDRHIWPSVPDGSRVILPEPGKTENLFDYCRLIENATELHLIDSCFAILADSLHNLKAKRKVIHLYARANALPPTYSPGWEILK